MKSDTLWLMAVLCLNGFAPIRADVHDVGVPHATVAISSSLSTGYGPAGALDGDRFQSAEGTAWKGAPDSIDGWWWQATFAEQRPIGSILQINGESGEVLNNSPRDYEWQYSDEGLKWLSLRETHVTDENRMYRLHRLTHVVRARHVRLSIDAAHGKFPTLREVEFYPAVDTPVDFPDWIISVDITSGSLGGQVGVEHVTVARRTEAGRGILAQQIGVGRVDPAYLAAEPKPLCMFLSGSFRYWCQVDRQQYRGLEQILKARMLPIWGSCGGCQLLPTLEETGVDNPWDCPHCRDPENPKLPIYTHINCTDRDNSKTTTGCGTYGECGWERGPMTLREVRNDPVFAGLPENGEFVCNQSHVGQIAYLPEGWALLATHGPGGFTVNQLMTVVGHPIYAAQFHIDMGGRHAEILIANFLNIARQWKQQPDRNNE